ncbi:hypothetical protein INR49_012703, partial [Caranx melampygus]
MVKDEQLPQRFRDMFFPGGRPLSPGSFLRMPTLAGVLEAGLSNFYDGNFSQEIVDEYYYSTIESLQPEVEAGHVVVMGPDDLMVSVTSSLSRPFGSRLITQSGVILNSLMLGFSWLNKTRGQFQTNQTKEVEPGKRPLSSLMPTVVVPAWRKCGPYMALSSSGGLKSFSVITQVLIRALSDYKEKNDSLSLTRLHPPNRSLVDSESLQDGMQVLHQKSRVAQRRRMNSAVMGILRSKDVIEAIEAVQLSD